MPTFQKKEIMVQYNSLTVISNIQIQYAFSGDYGTCQQTCSRSCSIESHLQFTITHLQNILLIKCPGKSLEVFDALHYVIDHCIHVYVFKQKMPGILGHFICTCIRILFS